MNLNDLEIIKIVLLGSIGGGILWQLIKLNKKLEGK